MKIALRIVLGFVGLVLLLVVLQVVASETGEVVVVHTVDDAGEPRETRIWVLEDRGRTYIRGGEGGWTSRVIASPDITVESGGQQRDVRGVLQTDDGTRIRVNRLFREKYGWRDSYISVLLGDPGREGAVVIEVVPRTP
ncbi:MAG: DUF2255 family protein [Deltaproteobacteria bacterium]|nr:DUF2255 family protein [Deltaproteobacteria bacterium]MBW2413172.1 DUF2255 family protein [Deltaproteobacteria bacterium]